MSSLKPYPEYKDSGIEWLGEVPHHWECRRLGTFASLRTAKAMSRSFPVALENIDSWSGRFINSESALSGDGTKFQQGDILFGKLRPYLAKVWLADCNGEAIGDFHVLATAPEIEPKFLQLAMLTPSFISLADGSTFGAKMPRVGWEFLRGVQWTLPPLDEQRAIASFLDHETAEIDAFIADQEQLIALLNERRAATITHAVTKGLDPNVPMKDSGVEWLGEVPEPWTVTLLKHFLKKVTDGAHISPETKGGLYDFVSTRDVSPEGIDFEGALKTSPETYEYMVRTGCQPMEGDVLFSKDGTVGRTVVVEGNKSFVVASSLIIMRPHTAKLSSKFLDYLCCSSFVREQVLSYVRGAGLPRLSITNLLRVVGIFPQLFEQQRIADYLDRETGAIDAAIADAKEAIELSRERRAALISAAVTGKIDVRDHPAAKGAA